MRLKAIAFVFSRRFPVVAVYMLQSVEYDVPAYLRWFWQTEDFRKIMYRRSLSYTRPAKLLLLALRGGVLLQLLAGFIIAANSVRQPSLFGWILAFALLFTAPLVWAHLVAIPLFVGRWLIIKPSAVKKIRASRKTFAVHPAVKIAVAGSYGKTTMKEMLYTVLSEGKKVAATEANKNVAVSHAAFARRLSGDEDILIIEYGEGAPGDVARFIRNTKPTIGVITGLAPAHLDKYKSLRAAGEDIFALAGHVGAGNAYVNGDSAAARHFIKNDYIIYSSTGVGEWKITSRRLSLEGISFTMKMKTKTLAVKSSLLGQHQIGPLAAVCALADRLGLSKAEIERGVAKIKPFEHRMQSYQLSGAWIIDDTYNGNIDGMRAGLALLADLPAKRKIYVTPGLVDQGPETDRVHHELGRMIAASDVDELVLMQNSVTDKVISGLGKGFKGKVIIIDDPLFFYENIDKTVAAGDLVLMQNDWTDNYR